MPTVAFDRKIIDKVKKALKFVLALKFEKSGYFE
jgi:hypothetical protein